MAQIKWLPEAKADLERLYEFINPHSPDAAARAVATIIETVGTLSNLPERGRPWEVDMRYRELIVPFGVRGYLVRYRVLEGHVIIVRVWHGLEARD